jgi:hypothetical protein
LASPADAVISVPMNARLAMVRSGCTGEPFHLEHNEEAGGQAGFRILNILQQADERRLKNNA